MAYHYWASNHLIVCEPMLKRRIFMISLLMFIGTCFMALHYLKYTHSFTAYIGRSLKFVTLDAYQTAITTHRHLPALTPEHPHQQPDIKFEFYSTFTTMQVKPPNIKQTNKNKLSESLQKHRQPILEAEELENDVLKHIK